MLIQKLLGSIDCDDVLVLKRKMPHQYEFSFNAGFIISKIFYFQIAFKEDSGKCKNVCTKSYDLKSANAQKKLSQMKKGMSMNYQHHWIVDNMPVRFYTFKNFLHIY